MNEPNAWWLTALVMIIAAPLTACTLVVEAFEGDVAQDGDGGSGGAGIDAGSEDIDCEGWAVYPEDFDPCSFIKPTGSLDLRNGSWLYDTATGMLLSPEGEQSTPTSELRAQSGADDIRVLSVTDLQIRESASLRAVGVYPLLILSFDEIAVEGQLSVASTIDGAGAGADSLLCGSLTGQSGASDDGIGSGGGGGALRASGGDGGNAITDEVTDGGSGGSGGVVLASFRGGCPGGDGGTSAGGPPGAGGGGLLLMARNRVRVSGQIGAGGQGAPATPAGGGGGGGGGSGGIIAINAEHVIVLNGGVLASNGGGGAEGSAEGPGRTGSDAQLSIQPASGGGTGGDLLGDGGQGGAVAKPEGSDGSDGTRVAGGGGGGGGGGGSAGVVIVSAVVLDVDSGAVISPELTTP